MPPSAKCRGLRLHRFLLFSGFSAFKSLFRLFQVSFCIPRKIAGKVIEPYGERQFKRVEELYFDPDVSGAAFQQMAAMLHVPGEEMQVPPWHAD